MRRHRLATCFRHVPDLVEVTWAFRLILGHQAMWKTHCSSLLQHDHSQCNLLHPKYTFSNHVFCRKGHALFFEAKRKRRECAAVSCWTITKQQMTSLIHRTYCKSVHYETCTEETDLELFAWFRGDVKMVSCLNRWLFANWLSGTASRLKKLYNKTAPRLSI